MARRNREDQQNAGEADQQIGDYGAGQPGGTEATQSGNSGITETTTGEQDGVAGMESESQGTTQDEYRGIDPSVAAGPEQPKKRRGRQPGSKNKPKSGSAKLAITPEQLAQQISFIHAGLAMMTGLPILALQDQESLQLSKSLIALAETYEIDLFGGKTAVLIQFGATVAMIYVPRFLMLRQIRAQMQAEAQRPENTDPHMTTASNGARPAGAFDYSALNDGAN